MFKPIQELDVVQHVYYSATQPRGYTTAVVDLPHGLIRLVLQIAVCSQLRQQADLECPARPRAWSVQHLPERMSQKQTTNWSCLRPSHRPTFDQSVNQSIDQSMKQSITHPTNQPTKASKHLLTASITPITDVVNACLLWSFEQTHHVVHNSLCTRCQIDYYLQHYAFIPVFRNGILTAAAAAAAAVTAATATSTATAAAAAAAVTAATATSTATAAAAAAKAATTAAAPAAAAAATLAVATEAVFCHMLITHRNPVEVKVSSTSNQLVMHTSLAVSVLSCSYGYMHFICLAFTTALLSALRVILLCHQAHHGPWSSTCCLSCASLIMFIAVAQMCIMCLLCVCTGLCPRRFGDAPMPCDLSLLVTLQALS